MLLSWRLEQHVPNLSCCGAPGQGCCRRAPPVQSLTLKHYKPIWAGLLSARTSSAASGEAEGGTGVRLEKLVKSGVAGTVEYGRYLPAACTVRDLAI